MSFAVSFVVGVLIFLCVLWTVGWMCNVQKALDRIADAYEAQNAHFGISKRDQAARRSAAGRGDGGDAGGASSPSTD